MKRESETGSRGPKIRCPLLRSTLMSRFSDDQWWTTAGMADALGSVIPDEQAVRFYRYMNNDNLPVGSVVEQVAKARKLVVAKVIASMMRESLVKMERRKGERFYKFIKPQTTTHLDVKASTPEMVPTTPGATKTGLTRFGVAAAIKKHGQIEFEDLLREIDPMFSPDIADWYRSVLEAGAKKRGSTYKQSIPQSEFAIAAKRCALNLTVSDLLAGGHATQIVTRVIKIKA